MSSKQLWAPWRMTYIKSEKSDSCLFCGYASQKNMDAPVLRITKHSYTVMNTYPYNAGHLLVMPKRHVRLLGDLSDEEYSDLSMLLRFSMDILDRELRPGGINVGLNIGKAAGAGIEHLHYHLVPRWVGDTNFMPVIGETKVIPEHLTDTYNKLLPGFRTGGK